MQNLISFVVGHQVLLSALAVALLDLTFALSPGLESNGILHALYLLIKPKPPQA